jgi:hypothetical protein
VVIDGGVLDEKMMFTYAEIVSGHEILVECVICECTWFVGLFRESFLYSKKLQRDYV